LHVLPFIILNMGGEMIYILDQRLRAQNIGNDRSQKVLQDVVKTMFSKKFIEEVFRQQEMFSVISTKQIFDKLAHSSIMKLNSTSMNKLFDLMLMGLKYQIVSCTFPEEIYQVTINHLNTVAGIVKGSASETLVTDTINLLQSTTATFGSYDYIVVRQSLLKFFQGKHIKVSLFIQDSIQSLDGTLFIDFGGYGPPFGEKPGNVTIFDEEGKKVKTKSLPLTNSEAFVDNTSKKRDGLTGTLLGTNMYAADRIPPQRRVSRPGAGSIVIEPKEKVKPAFELEKEELKSPKTEEENEEAKKNRANYLKNELNSLASLIRPNEGDTQLFKLNLFPEKASAGGGSQVSAKDNIIHFDLGSGADSKMKEIMKDFDEVTKISSAQEEEDDLLDLMDEASK